MMMAEWNHRVGAEEDWGDKQSVTRLSPREGPRLPPEGMALGMILLAITVIEGIKAIAYILLSRPAARKGYSEAKGPDGTRCGRGKPLPSAERRGGERSAGGGNIGRGQGSLESERGRRELGLRTVGVGGRGVASGGEERGENVRGVRKAPVNAGGINDNTDAAASVSKVLEEVGPSLVPSAGLQGVPASRGGDRSCKPRERRRHKTKQLSQASTPATKATAALPTTVVSSSKERKGIEAGVGGAYPGGGWSEGVASRLLHRGKEPRGILGSAKPQKGSILGIHPWCGGLRLTIPDDGDCFGIAWMVGALIWGAQDRRVMKHILARLAVAREAGAFLALTPEQQASVGDLVEFISGIHRALAIHNGVDMAMSVIRTLMTSSDLHRAIVYSSRALDLWCVHGIEDGKDLKRWRTIGEAVEFNLGETLPSGDIMRPALGLQLLLDLHMERLGRNADGGDCRIVEGCMELFRASSNGGHPEVVGISLLKGALPHYDVFLDALTSLGKATSKSFGTPPLPTDDPGALVELRLQQDSQAQMSLGDLANVIGQDAFEEALRAEREWAAAAAAAVTAI